MPSLALRLTGNKPAEKNLAQAKRLLCSQDPADIRSALGLLEAILTRSPQWEKAIELKARALLCLRRFKDVANLLQESIPSLRAANSQHLACTDPDEDTVELLLPPASSPQRSTRKRRRRGQTSSLLQCFPFFALPRKLSLMSTGLYGKEEKEQWRCIVLGQACCHLGMMEDAMILLSNGKRAASGVARKRSSHQKDDDFVAEGVSCSPESDIVRHLLANIKLLLRRRAVAIAAFDAGLYKEAIRNFSKIIDGKRGTPQGFIAECYMYRAMACEAQNRIIDAIADCNRSLVLNPMSAEALSVRATVYESIGCGEETLRDLERLRGLYQKVMMRKGKGGRGEADIEGCIEYIEGRAKAVKERLKVANTGGGGGGGLDYHRILGVSRGCNRREAERAYMLLAMKHRPDRSAHFVERCEFVDDRHIDSVKEEARNLGLNLFAMLQKAYAGIMSLVLEEEVRRELKGEAIRKRHFLLKDEAEAEVQECLLLPGHNPSLMTLTGSARKLDQEEESRMLSGMETKSSLNYTQASTCREEAAILTISTEAWISVT